MTSSPAPFRASAEFAQLAGRPGRGDASAVHFTVLVRRPWWNKASTPGSWIAAAAQTVARIQLGFSRAIRRPNLKQFADVTTVTLETVTDSIKWLVLLVQVPAEPSRHRVAVWRQLRKTGAAPIHSGSWVIPDAPAFTEGIERAKELCRNAGGSFTILHASPDDAQSTHALDSAFRAARVDEWNEFLGDCNKFMQEIAKEISIEKFTYAELEEEDQSLERLRRWYRELKKRDVLWLEEAVQADEALRAGSLALEEYARLVYAAENEI